MNDCPCTFNACGCRECVQHHYLRDAVARIVGDSAYGNEGHVLGRLNVILYRYDNRILVGDPAENSRLPSQQASEEPDASG